MKDIGTIKRTPVVRPSILNDMQLTLMGSSNK
jgi:hypothetical protein